MLANYYAHCTALDDCVGTLWAALKESALDNNTLIVFSSDHGDLLGSHGRQNKQQPYDESIRVPLLLHWPAGLGTRPRTVDAMIGSEDLMPTILGLCGIRIPDTVEGRNYGGYLNGGENPSDGAELISCATPFGEWSSKQGGKEYRGVRTKRFTYVRDLTGPWLLFDNELDPYQQTNLVGQPQHASLQAELNATLEQKLHAAHDQFLPGETYLKKWGYALNKDGNIPYMN
jgi:arylsulfatase A-like enzyme